MNLENNEISLIIDDIIKQANEIKKREIENGYKLQVNKIANSAGHPNVFKIPDVVIKHDNDLIKNIYQYSGFWHCPYIPSCKITLKEFCNYILEYCKLKSSKVLNFQLSDDFRDFVLESGELII